MVTSRIWFTAAQKAELWERWKNGQSAAAISRALERKNKTGVERIVVLHGGIGPAPRRRALAALRFEEREEISRGIAVGRSIRQIAQGLGRAPSTVSREIRRNGGSQVYRANRADRRARERALRPKPCRLALVQRATMARGAEARAAMVAAADLRLAEAGVPNPPRHADISRSDLSQPLHPDPRRAEKGAGGAVAYCAADASPQEPQREEWTGAYPRYGLYPQSGPPRLRIALCRGIGKETYLTGANDTHIATLIERNTRFTMLIKIPRKGHDDCCCCACQATSASCLEEFATLPDLGSRQRDACPQALHGCHSTSRFYFCDPRSPWQRGSNENTNGLLACQYLPSTKPISRASLRELSERNCF